MNNESFFYMLTLIVNIQIFTNLQNIFAPVLFTKVEGNHLIPIGWIEYQLPTDSGPETIQQRQ